MPSIHHYSFVHRVPDSVSRKYLLSLLHEPTTIFHLSPIIVGWEELESSNDHDVGQPPSTRVFEVTDAVSFLPFGLYDTTVKVKIEFANFDGGVVITKRAIFGLVFRETWTVEYVGESENDGETTGEHSEVSNKHLQLSLDVEMSGNALTVPAFRGMMEKNHMMYLEKMVERASETAEQHMKSGERINST